MRITVNGENQDVPEGSRITDLLTIHKLNPRHVAVEVNRALVPRGDYDRTVLSEGDHVEIVTLVGGG